jgi:hypothetical protein
MMNTKHKSKYQKPKDLEKSQKPKARKDLKDYTTDDKEGKLNPKSDGAIIPNLLRKTDKPFVDDGTYDVKWNADDRLYADLENGDYDPKKALKKLKKREDKEEKEIADVIKDKKENLTRESLRDRVKKLTVEQKESLIKEYIRRKVRTAFLNEQGEPVEAEPVEAEPAEVPAPAVPGTVTEPTAAAPTAAPAPAETPVEEPETPESVENEKQAKETVAVSKYVESLKAEEGPFNKVTSIGNVIQLAITDLAVADKARFFIELRKMATKNLVGLQADLSKTK